MSSAQWNAGQAHGQAKAKTEEWVQSAQNTANKARDKVADSRESAQQGREQWNAGQTRGQAQAKTEEWVQSAQNTANRACDKMADSRESAQQGKEQSAGFLQQTGEQVIHLAQGAIDGVKNTLGVNEKK